MAHQLYVTPGIRKIIPSTILALTEKILPIKTPVTTHKQAYMPPKTIEMTRHNLTRLERTNTARGHNSNNQDIEP